MGRTSGGGVTREYPPIEPCGDGPLVGGAGAPEDCGT